MYEVAVVEDAEPPRLPLQDIGGWVYERAYLQFRFKAPDTYIGDELEDYYENPDGTFQSLLDGLEEILEPTYREQLCFRFAIELYEDQERYGFAYSGGHSEQPLWYKYIYDCVRTARDRADDLSHREEARDHARQQAENENTDAAGMSDV